MDLFLYDDILVYRSIYAPVKSNMYIIMAGQKAVVFDPCEDEALLELFRENGIERVYILLTHEHYDHTSGLKWLRQNTNNSLFCHKAVGARLSKGRGSLPQLVAFVLYQQDRQDGGHRYDDFKKSYQPYTCKANKTFLEEENFTIGDLTFQATSTPGHSPGSACYVLNDKIVFTGDTLLQNDAAITRFPESNEKDYQEVALPYLQSLRKDMIVMPGHGEPFVLREAKFLG